MCDSTSLRRWLVALLGHVGLLTAVIALGSSFALAQCPGTVDGTGTGATPGKALDAAISAAEDACKPPCEYDIGQYIVISRSEEDGVHTATVRMPCRDPDDDDDDDDNGGGTPIPIPWWKWAAAAALVVVAVVAVVATPGIPDEALVGAGAAALVAS